MEPHSCRTCSSPLVQPVDWSQAEGSDWLIVLWCPDCQWMGSGVFTCAEVSAFDAELDRGTEQLVADLSRLARASFESELEQFIGLLNAGLVSADDFG